MLMPFSMKGLKRKTYSRPLRNLYNKGSFRNRLLRQFADKPKASQQKHATVPRIFRAPMCDAEPRAEICLVKV